MDFIVAYSPRDREVNRGGEQRKYLLGQRCTGRYQLDSMFQAASTEIDNVQKEEDFLSVDVQWTI